MRCGQSLQKRCMPGVGRSKIQPGRPRIREVLGRFVAPVATKPDDKRAGGRVEGRNSAAFIKHDGNRNVYYKTKEGVRESALRRTGGQDRSKGQQRATLRTAHHYARPVTACCLFRIALRKEFIVQVVGVAQHAMLPRWRTPLLMLLQPKVRFYFFLAMITSSLVLTNTRNTELHCMSRSTWQVLTHASPPV